MTQNLRLIEILSRKLKKCTQKKLFSKQSYLPSLFHGLLLFYLQLLCVFLNGFRKQLRIMVIFYNHIKILWRQSFLDIINTLFETLKSLSFSKKTSWSLYLVDHRFKFYLLTEYLYQAVCMYILVFSCM